MRGGYKTRPKLILALVLLAALFTPAMADEVDDLISDLKDEDSHVRYDAASALGKIGDNRAVAPLIEALKDEDYWVRWAASEALGAIGDASAVDPLIERLKDESKYVRGDAARALGAIGDDEAVDPLIETLEDDDSGVRSGAARALGDIGDAKGVDPLIAALKDGDFSVRVSAAFALGAIGDDRAVDPLIEALEDDDYWVRRGAASALGSIGDARGVVPLIETLKDENSDVRMLAVWALGNIGDARAVDPLTTALKDEDERVQNAASYALAKIVIPATADEVDEVEDFILKLNDGDFSVRMQAANALGNIKDVRAVDLLIEALKDESYFVRMAAAMALGRIGDGRAVEPLITYLNDECYHCSGYAVDALVAIGGPAVDPLIEALKDESSCVRRAAVEALGTIGDARAIDPLIASLIDEDSDVRENATDALVLIGQPAIDPLTEALKDEDELVRNAATEVLQRIPVKEIRYEEAPSNIFEDKGIIGTADVSQLASVGITAGDADGDGDPDLFTVSGRTGIEYFENVETDQGREFVYRGNVSTLELYGLEHYDIVFTDIDQDGVRELVTASRDTNIILHENISNGSEILFENRGEIDTTRVRYSQGISITADDVNNDNKQDIFTATERGFAEVYVQYDQFSFSEFVIGKPKGRNVGIDTADLNNDGLLDAVTASKEDGVLYFRQIEYSRPKFETSTIQEPDDYPGTWRDLVLTDVDMDGDIDALITSTRDISYLENIRSVTEFEFVNRGVVGDPEAHSEASANIIALDYDMDGDQDFIVATPDKLKLFENTIIDY